MQELSSSFLYFVSSSSTTGKAKGFSDDQISQFKSIAELNLSVPVLMGFGIYNAETFQLACDLFDGGIVGSAFIRSQKEKVGTSVFIEELING
jgi:tryptophan synthase alpha chain